MTRFCALTLAAFLLAGCRIEPTPQRYIDPQESLAEEIRRSEEELRSRLRDLGAALQRRDVPGLTAALAPHNDVVAFGPETDEILTGYREVVEALTRAADAGAITVGEVSVNVGPRNSIAWFHATYTVEPAAPDRPGLVFSGVFTRQEGQWRLIQGHFSRPISPPPAPPPVAVGTPAAAG